MGDMKVSADVKHAEIGAKIIRADGTEEDLGVIAEYNRPEGLIPRLWKKIRKKE